jgi:hypothetical protein
LAQLVFPPALSAGLNINETILYSRALSCDFLVFVLALAGDSNFMGFNPVQMVQNGKTARTFRAVSMWGS